MFLALLWLGHKAQGMARSHKVGMIHARNIVTVTATDDSFRISLDSQTISVVPRATTREIHRYKAYGLRRDRCERGSRGH